MELKPFHEVAKEDLKALIGGIRTRSARPWGSVDDMLEVRVDALMDYIMKSDLPSEVILELCELCVGLQGATQRKFSTTIVSKARHTANNLMRRLKQPTVTSAS